MTRSIKGSLGPGSAVAVSGACTLAANKDLKGQYGMFFLSKTAGNLWALLPSGAVAFETAYFPLSKASSPASITTHSPPTTVTDQIAVELAAGLQSYSSPLQLYTLANGLRAMPDSAIIKDLFQSLRASSDPELKFLALAKFLRGGDPSALAEVAANIDLLPRLTVSSFVISEIYGRRDSDPAAIAHLGRISASSDPYVQRGAADALMRIHTRDALPFLAQLLDGSDPRTRELAIAGFSRFVENLPIETQFNTLNGQSKQPQGPAPYRTPQTDKYSLSMQSLAGSTLTEAEYVQFWKSWWATMSPKLAPGK